MFKNFKETLKNKEVQKKLLFTILIFAVYRYGCTLTVPGINKESVKISTDSVFAIMNLIGGGALNNFSIFALGVGPFITASIIVELMAGVIPYLEDIKEEGEKGKKKIERISRFLALFLAIIQGWSIVYGFNAQYHIMTDTGILSYAFIITILVGGTMAVSWLADMITVHGIGNGMSMLIFAGIVSSLPNTFYGNFSRAVLGSAETGQLAQGILHFICFVLIYLALILGVVVIESAEKRIHIMSSNGRMSNGSTSSFMPVKLNSAGVIPIIFAQSIITVPQMIVSFANYDVYQKMNAFLSFGSATGIAVYGVLTFLMAFFYTSVVLDTEEISERFKKEGFFIPNIRPGKDTEKYLNIVINRTTLIGAVFITVMAVLPYVLALFSTVTSTAALGGTGVIVAVGVLIETMANLESIQTENKYNTAWF
mgnify:FL=1